MTNLPISFQQQDNQDNADIVEDLEDKLEEVEDEQKSIREHVHRVTSWNEVVRAIFGSFFLHIARCTGCWWSPYLQ